MDNLLCLQNKRIPLRLAANIFVSSSRGKKVLSNPLTGIRGDMKTQWSLREHYMHIYFAIQSPVKYLGLDILATIWYPCDFVIIKVSQTISTNMGCFLTMVPLGYFENYLERYVTYSRDNLWNSIRDSFTKFKSVGCKSAH